MEIKEEQINEITRHLLRYYGFRFQCGVSTDNFVREKLSWAWVCDNIPFNELMRYIVRYVEMEIEFTQKHEELTKEYIDNYGEI